RTVGWFTELYPLAFELPLAASADTSAREELTLADRFGRAFSLRSSGRDPLSSRVMAPWVSVDYTGSRSGMSSGFLRPSTGPIGERRELENRAPYLLEALAELRDGSLQL